MLKPVALVLAILAPAGHAVAQEPQWLTDARAREGQDLRPRAVRSADGFFTGTVLGRVLSDEIVADDGVYAIEIDIGSETPASCEVVVDGFDLAGMLRDTADVTLKEVETLLGTVEGRAVERTDAGVYGATPYLALDWIFRVNDGKASRIGALKQVVAATGDHGLYCAHVDLGYARSFEAAARALAESLQFEAPGPAPHFTEISTASLKGRKIGVAIVTMERDADGDTRVRTVTSLAVPVTPDTLQAQDASHVQWVRPDGSLINAFHVVVTNGEVETEIGLTPAGEGRWLVGGEFKGQAIEQVLEPAPAPGTLIQESLARRALFGSADAVGAQVTAPQWTTADPTRILPSQTTVLAIVDGDRLRARETMEGLSIDLVLDRATGLPSSAVMQVGPLSIEVERVYVQGAF